MNLTLKALTNAERFIAGFDGDEMQEGIGDLLAEIRGAIFEQRHANGMKFLVFQESRKRTETLKADLLFDDDSPERGGYIYDDGYISDHWDGDGGFHLLIGTQEWEASDLEYLEKILWAAHRIATDDDVLRGSDIDAFIQGWCAFYNIRMNGDIFAHYFSDKEVWGAVEAAETIRDAAKTFKLWNT